ILLLMDVNIIGFFRRVQTYFQRTDNTESITPLYILPLNGIAPYGDWVSEDWIHPVLAVAGAHPEYNFICLTKNPRRYLSFDFPANIWLGATADTQKRFDTAMSIFDKLDVGNIKFLSCEPLLESIGYTEQQVGILDWMIIGGLKRSENTDRQPKREWVDNLIEFARKSDAKIYFKTNLTVQTSLGMTPKEFPM
ncbi:MAG: DUF5131 family protein, partial [Desulfatirhabdiaceae bacterium]